MSAWAGIRPLVADDAVNPGVLSREHAIHSSEHGVVSITGGKLTTYRVMARDVIESVVGKIRRGSRTLPRPLPGGDFESVPDLVGRIAEATHDAALAEHLASSFGTRWQDVWAEMQADVTRVVDDLPYTYGELRYSARCGDGRDARRSAHSAHTPRVRDARSWNRRRGQRRRGGRADTRLGQNRDRRRAGRLRGRGTANLHGRLNPSAIRLASRPTDQHALPAEPGCNSRTRPPRRAAERRPQT